MFVARLIISNQTVQVRGDSCLFKVDMYLNTFSLSVQIVFMYQDPTYKFLHTQESYIGFQNQIFLYRNYLMPLEILCPSSFVQATWMCAIVCTKPPYLSAENSIWGA